MAVAAMCDLAPGSKVMCATFRRTVGGRSNPGGADQRTRGECWGAKSADGRWVFERVEEPGTPWLLLPADPAVRARVGWVAAFGSLAKARRAVTAGWPVAELSRRVGADAALVAVDRAARP